MLLTITGYRKLSDIAYLANDPLILRILSLRKLPSVSTLSRGLNLVTSDSVQKLRALCRRYVLGALISLPRITLDFDGSVQSTTRHAEGSAIGYNKKKKGARSYYPLFCTIAQTGQFLDMHHRPGNVHDSNGSTKFIQSCIEETRAALGSSTVMESRLDGAFFAEERIELLLEQNIEFTISVPFHRLPELKFAVEARKRWNKIDDNWSFFELEFAPQSWESTDNQRVIITRQKKRTLHKGPLQLDLFYPVSYEFDYQAIMTNKSLAAKSVIKFHHGRGVQEDLIGQAKNEAQMDYIPVKARNGNQIYCLAAMFAHNITKRIQMDAFKPRTHKATPTRAPLWQFRDLKTLRNNLIRRAGKIVRPQGKLKLIVSATSRVERQMNEFLHAA